MVYFIFDHVENIIFVPELWLIYIEFLTNCFIRSMKKLIVNLNEPNKIDDMSWFEPKKYMGIWWEMHIGKGRWDYGMTMNDSGHWIDSGNAHGEHSATTENTKKYIDNEKNQQMISRCVGTPLTRA